MGIELTSDLIAWGLIGLFVGSFLAATILPFSSEALLISLLLGGYEPWTCWIVASLGNTLGGITGYWLGKLGNERLIHKVMGVRDNHKIRKNFGIIRRYGSYAALMTWLPIIGDLLAIAMGILNTKFIPTTALMFLGKAARYAVLIWITCSAAHY